MSTLCDVCKRIQFAMLACPTADDILNARQLLRNAQKYPRILPFRGSFAEMGDDHSEDEINVNLGTLDRIHQESKTCALCHLIYYTLHRRGLKYLGGRPIPRNDSNIIYYAQFGSTYHSYLTESPTDTYNNSPDYIFTLKRLAVAVKFNKPTQVDDHLIDSVVTLAAYKEIAQACHASDFLPAQENGISPKPDAPRMLFAGRKRPDTIDFSLARKWMEICASSHDLSCGIEEKQPDSSSIRMDLIRLIDVKNRCLCVMRDVVLEQLEYAALSYVWGSARQVKLDEQLESVIFERNALSQLDLPQTIKDAIDVAENLHVSFLWIDVLCIRQGQTEDDIKDRQQQLNHMGGIYGNALVTIVATGDDANSGLPGLRPGSRSSEQLVVRTSESRGLKSDVGFDLVSMCSSCPPWTGYAHGRPSSDNDIDCSIWNTRAWTFQERSLSRRCLIFSPEICYWSCDGAYFSEESSFEHPNLYQHGAWETPLRLEYRGSTGCALSVKTIDGPLAHLTTNRKSFWNRLKGSIHDYSGRHLTHAGDILDAFKSVLDSFERLSGEKFHWGHPRSRFGSSLLWSSPSHHHNLHRRVEKTSLPTTNLNIRVRLPSWSWMGWEGLVNIKVDEMTLENESCEISCFEHTSSPFQISCIEGTNKYTSNYSPTFEKPTTQISIRPWQKDRRSNITWEDIQQQNPLISETALQQIPNGHIIFFWASTATLYVERPTELDPLSYTWNQDKPTLDPGVKINVDEEKIVGTVDKMGEAHWNSDESAAGWHEFAVIGRREVSYSGALDMPSKVIALQLRWNGGIAERVNIAEIEENAWDDLNPVWKLIALI